MEITLLPGILLLVLIISNIQPAHCNPDEIQEEQFCKDIRQIAPEVQDSPFDELIQMCSKPERPTFSEIQNYLNSAGGFYGKLGFSVPQQCSQFKFESKMFENNPERNTFYGLSLTPASKQEILDSLTTGLQICEQEVTHDTRSEFFKIVVHLKAIFTTLQPMR